MMKQQTGADAAAPVVFILIRLQFYVSMSVFRGLQTADVAIGCSVVVSPCYTEWLGPELILSSLFWWYFPSCSARRSRSVATCMMSWCTSWTKTRTCRRSVWFKWPSLLVLCSEVKLYLKLVLFRSCQSATSCPSNSLRRRSWPRSTATLWWSSEERRAAVKPPRFLSTSWTASSKQAKRLTATSSSHRWSFLFVHLQTHRSWTSEEIIRFNSSHVFSPQQFTAETFPESHK